MTYKTPEQIADEIAALPGFASLTVDDLGLSVEVMMVRAIEADRAQHKALLEREASILDDYRRGLEGHKVPEATEHNMSRASEAMRLAAGWDAVEACRVSFS